MTGVCADFVTEGDDRRAEGPSTRVDGSNISSPKATCVLDVSAYAYLGVLHVSAVDMPSAAGASIYINTF